MRLTQTLQKILASERLVPYLILATVMGIMLYTVAPTLNHTGYLTAWDAGGHLLKASWFAHHQLLQSHTSGWFPLWHGGFDLFQFYPPLLYYILGPLTLIMPAELALRIVVAGLWIALVPATYYFLRSWRASRNLAALGTGLLLALNASFGIGLGALYGVGLLPNGLGCVLAIFALGRLKRDLTWPDRGLKQSLITAMSIALLILAHTFSAYWFAVASVLLLASESIDRTWWAANLKRFALLWLVALLLSAYWWVPLALGLHQIGATGALQKSPTSSIFHDLLTAKGSGGLTVSVLALVGLGWLWFRAGKRAAVFFMVLAVVTLLLSLNFINGALPFASVIASSQYIRFQAFFVWLLAALAMFGLIGTWQLVRRIPLPYVPVAAYVSLLLVIGSSVVLPTLRENTGFITVVDNKATRELPAVRDYLAKNLRPGEFILSEFNWDSRNYFGSPHFVNQRLPMLDEKIWDLDGNFPEGTTGATQPVLVASVLSQPDFVITQHDYLVSRGVRYIVSTNPDTRPSLATIPWLTPVFHERTLSIYEITDFRNSFGLPPTLAGHLSSATFQPPNTYHLTFDQSVTIPARTAMALSAHPWLRFKRGNQTFASAADADHRLVVPRQLDNVRNLQIVYQPSVPAQAAVDVSLLTRIVVLLLLLVPARFRQRAGQRVRHLGRR